MKTRRYSEARVFLILQEVDSGIPVVDAAWEHGVSSATIHRWKSKYRGMTLSELKRLKALEEENARLKRIVAQQAIPLIPILLQRFQLSQLACYDVDQPPVIVPLLKLDQTELLLPRFLYQS